MFAWISSPENVPRIDPALRPRSRPRPTAGPGRTTPASATREMDQLIDAIEVELDRDKRRRRCGPTCSGSTPRSCRRCRSISAPSRISGRTGSRASCRPGTWRRPRSGSSTGAPRRAESRPAQRTALPARSGAPLPDPPPARGGGSSCSLMSFVIYAPDRPDAGRSDRPDGCSGDPHITAADVARLKALYGLDRPLSSAAGLGSAARCSGDLGYSRLLCPAGARGPAAAARQHAAC